jgi:hypothetical protein
MTQGDPLTAAGDEETIRRLARYRAAAALRGFTITRKGEAFVVGRWGLWRELRDLDQVEALLHLAGAAL